MDIKKNGWPFHSQDEIDAVNQVLLSGRTNYWTGTECIAFEKEYAAFIGTKFAVALMNGTVALEAALYALDIGPGDEVITSCRTFIASASCIVMRGATPVLVDVDINSQNITAETIEPYITPRTKAIIVVHLAGWPADMESILALAHKYNIKVIEDCAQAHGAKFKDRRVGAIGHIGAFSFCQDKIITTGGEGGMITTDDREIWQKIWSFKDHGKNYEKVYQPTHSPGYRWLHDSFGTNWRMTEMQAAIGRIQLKKIEYWLALRKKNANSLTQQFKDVPQLRVPIPPSHIEHAYYKYYVFLNETPLKRDLNRDAILQKMNAMGIPCFVGSASDIYFERAFLHQNIKQHSPKAVAPILERTSLALLVHPTLDEKDMQKTADALLSIL